MCTEASSCETLIISTGHPMVNGGCGKVLRRAMLCTAWFSHRFKWRLQQQIKRRLILERAVMEEVRKILGVKMYH